MIQQDENRMSLFDVLRSSKVRPVVPVGGSEAEVEFALYVNGEYPVLQARMLKGEVDRLPMAQQRIISEITHMSSLNSFGMVRDWGDKTIPPVNVQTEPHILNMALASGRVVSNDGAAITLSEASTVLEIELTANPETGMIEPRINAIADGEVLADAVILTDSMVFSANAIYPVATIGDNFALMRELIAPFPAEQAEIYLSIFLSYFSNITPRYGARKPGFLSASEVAVPAIVLEKVAADMALYLRVVHMVESSAMPFDSQLTLSRTATIDDDHILVRNIEELPLTGSIATLTDMVLSSAPNRQARKDVFVDNNFFIIPAETASPFLINNLHQILLQFRLIGSEKLKEYKVTPAVPKLKLSLSSGIDFLEGDAEVQVADEKFTLADFLSQFSKNHYVTLSDGNRAILDNKYMQRLQRLYENHDRKGRIKVSFFDLPEVESMIDSKLQGEFASNARAVFKGFAKVSGKNVKDVNVNATLRSYQTDGVAWLEYLYDNKLGGCLADDMGLGKTLQTISLLSRIYPKATRPSLIVMPRSLLFNWENELSRFAPQLTFATYYGPDRNLEESLKAQVILTTYAMVRNDVEALMPIEFDTVILDESQNIKNLASQTAHAVTLLKADHRFALSGTPMENNLTEIYSLFRFLNPTMFGTVESFNSRYTYPIQKSGDADAMQSLRRKIYPFMLRRLKRDVLTELPDRIEQEIYVEMSESQAKLYNSRRLAFKAEIDGTIAREGVGKAQFVMFQALNELRRIASVPESLSDGKVLSPKIPELVDSLAQAAGNGHKSVVFFNYIAGLELLGAKLDALGVQFETMTGSTSAAARKKIVTRFQSDPSCTVLLMTLKVGGVGLNLTAADTVYIFEPWWNRAAEEQAINRLHRIGQKATVNSYSIITVNTIEEKIRQLQQQKSELFDRLIGADSASSKQLSKEDIDFILS